MLQVILIRPGSTEFDREGRIQGTLDIPLSEQGLREVAGTIEELREKGIQLLYTGPGEAAEQTGAAIAEALQLKSKTVEKLQNLNHGLWQGMLVDEVKTKQPKVYRQWQEHPENICPPDGETLASAMSRVQEVMARLIKKHKEGVIGLVVAEPLATLVRAHLRHDPLGDLWKSDACARWEEIVVTPEAVSAGP